MVALGSLAVVIVAAIVTVRALRVDTHGAQVVHFTIASTLLHRSMSVAAVIPAGASNRPRPLLVFLHGRSGNQDSELGDDQLYSSLAGLDSRAPDIVFPDGGDHSYWHDRADGAWGSYVVSEVIPQAVSRLHADPSRIAIGGISMGAFGALDIARLNPGRFCAAGAHSGALWVNGGYSAAGAFDDAQDFANHDVIAAAGGANSFSGTAIWVDVGTQDPFRAADTTFAETLRSHGHAVQFHVWPGSHGNGYWQSHWHDYLGFYATALEDCHHV